ncbi:hypothetical protein [uncultured Jannaschia sp.]|uniref:hypothetical protein n=1 Tax=uncultured Jannaschia sp. TaxID=293347 RepID=UPI0026285D62|nr:hypothetical protein [uncultured Jannaschia sp.]
MTLGAATLVHKSFVLALREVWRFAAIYAGSGIVAALVEHLFAAWAGQEGATLVVELTDISIIAVIGVILVVGLNLWATLAVVTVLTARATGVPIPLGAALRRGLRRTPAGFVLVLLSCLLVAAIWFAVTFLSGFLAALNLSAFFFALGIAAIAFAACWVYACLFVVLPVFVAEDAGLSAIGRSVDLTRNHRAGLVGAAILLGLATLALYLVPILVIAGIDPWDELGPLGFAGVLAVSFAMATFAGALATALQAAAYARLREIEVAGDSAPTLPDADPVRTTPNGG